jgi:hypothetical protein
MTSSIEAVRMAFLNAPVWNPDGIIGVNLRVNVDDTTPIPDDHPCTNVWPEFDTLKRDYFGTQSERMANPTNIVNEKKDVYHYAIFAHQICGSPGSSGLGEILGQDLIVSLGDPGWIPMLFEAESGTLMHELGHNLGLKHGGGMGSTATVNCKPNYISVMSYSFQLPNFVSDRRLDYSRSVITPGLNENALNEQAGIGPSTPAGLRTVYGPPPPLTSITGQPIDWNRDGDTRDTGVVRNINNLGITDCNSSTLQTLYGFKDWDGLIYWAGNGAGFSNGTSIRSLEATGQTLNQPINYTTPPCDITNPLCLTSACDPSDPGAASCSFATNFTSPTLSVNDTYGRDGAYPDITINDVRKSRGLLASGINQTIQNTPDSDFANSTSPIQEKNKFGLDLTKVANLAQADLLEEAIIKLYDVRARMDSEFGESKTNDVIVNPESQMKIVPLIDNLIEALQKQM